MEGKGSHPSSSAKGRARFSSRLSVQTPSGASGKGKSSPGHMPKRSRSPSESLGSGKKARRVAVASSVPTLSDQRKHSDACSLQAPAAASSFRGVSLPAEKCQWNVDTRESPLSQGEASGGGAPETQAPPGLSSLSGGCPTPGVGGVPSSSGFPSAAGYGAATLNSLVDCLRLVSGPGGLGQPSSQSPLPPPAPHHAQHSSCMCNKALLAPVVPPSAPIPVRSAAVVGGDSAGPSCSVSVPMTEQAGTFSSACPHGVSWRKATSVPQASAQLGGRADSQQGELSSQLAALQPLLLSLSSALTQHLSSSPSVTGTAAPPRSGAVREPPVLFPVDSAPLSPDAPVSVSDSGEFDFSDEDAGE